MKTLYLIRGLPGSGKSTLAKKLAFAHHEADSFFMQDGVYKYDPTLINAAHIKCQGDTECDMALGYSTVVVANTFTRQWEMEPYKALARKYGYQVVVLTVDSGLTDEQLADRTDLSGHHVPIDVITKMRARWEN